MGKSVETGIKPCPYCGGTAKLEQVEYGFSRIQCQACAVMIMSSIQFGGDLDALTIWNRRVK